jgi:hypothetical protein
LDVADVCDGPSRIIGVQLDEHPDAERYMHTLIFLSSISITKVKVRVSFVM